MYTLRTGESFLFITCIVLLHRAFANLCPIKAQVCISAEEYGFIEVNHTRLATWKCDDFTDTTWHTAFVTGSCQYFRLMDSITSDHMDGLYNRWQQVPFGGYFIWVTSKNGFLTLFDHISSAVPNERYQYHVEFLQSLGILLHKRATFDTTLVDADIYVNLLSSDEAFDANYRDYLTCRDTKLGREYRGSVSLSSGGYNCQPWVDQTPASHPYHPDIYPELQENYCRQLANPNYEIGTEGVYCIDTDAEEEVDCTINVCDQTNDGLAVISHKVFFDMVLPPNKYSWAKFTIPENRPDAVVKVIGSRMKSRSVSYHFNADPNFCVQPLLSMERWILNPLQHGQYDHTYRDMQIGNTKLHLVTSEPIGCNGHVYGWQFIPANPGTVYFTILREKSPDLHHRGSHRVDIEQSMINDDLEIQYVCTRSSPFTRVHLGDKYGFYTENFSQSYLAPLKRVFPMKYDNNLLATRFRPLLYHDAGQVDIYDLDARNVLNSSRIPLALPSGHHIMSLALKPILNIDFIYTCGCRNDSMCEMFGDKHMKCVSNSCNCKEKYVYNSKLNLCVYALDALGKDVAMVEPYVDDGNYAAPSLAVDGNLYTHTLNIDVASDPDKNTWLVVDLGHVTNVLAVSIAGSRISSRHVELWSSLSAYEAGAESDARIYDRYVDNLPSINANLTIVEVIEVHGAFAWRIYNPDGSRTHVINIDQKDGVTVYKYNALTPMEGLGSVGLYTYKITQVQMGYLRTEDGYCWGKSGSEVVSYLKLDTGNCGTVTDSLLLYVSPMGPAATDGLVLFTEVNGTALNYVDGRIMVGGDTPLVVHGFWVNRDFNSYEPDDPLLDFTTDIQHIIPDGETQCFTAIPEFGAAIELEQCNFAKPFQFELAKNMLPATYIEESYEPPFSDTSQRRTSLDNVFIDIVSTFGGSEAVGVGSTGQELYNWNLMIRDRQGNEVQNQTNFLMKYYAKQELLHDFKLGVSKHFDGFNYVDDYFKMCTYVSGYIHPETAVLIDCNEPIKGRYVAYYAYNEDFNLKIAEIAVHTLPGCLRGEKREDCVLVNDCNLIKHGCQQLCMESLESDYGYKCECLPGFKLNADGVTCFWNHTASYLPGAGGDFPYLDIYTDYNELPDSPGSVPGFPGEDPYMDPSVDPCPTNTLGCQQICARTTSGAECRCYRGYKLNSDHTTCRDINECYRQNGGCSDVCTNTVGSYQCSCFHGFTLAVNQHHCIDINECAEEKTLCGHICINTPGSYICQCDVNFRLLSNGDCVSLNSMDISINLAIPYTEEYADIESDQYNQLTLEIDVVLQKVCNKVQLVALKCNVMDEPFLEKNEGIELTFMATSEREIQDSEKGPVTMALQQILNETGNELEVFGDKVSTGPIELRMGFQRIQVSSVCDIFDETDYCENGGKCVPKEDKPVCSCLENYYGKKCEVYLVLPTQSSDRVKVSAASSPVSMNGVITGFCLLGAVILGLFGVFFYFVKNN